MNNHLWNETFVEQEIAYVIIIDNKPLVIEHVPARINSETGERLFSPETVERIQEIIRTRRTPDRMIQTPVFDFAA